MRSMIWEIKKANELRKVLIEKEVATRIIKNVASRKEKENSQERIAQQDKRQQYY